MKVLFVHKDLNQEINAGGINTVYLKHIEELQKTDNDLYVITSREGKWNLKAKRYVVSVDIDKRNKEIEKIIKEIDPDIIDVFSWGAELLDYVKKPHRAKIIMRADIPMKSDGDVFISQPVEADGKTYLCTAVSMGNPHCITFVDDPDNIELEKIGPVFENHPLFPDRVNTEFISIIDKNNIKMRVWERGSGETMACGTGSCAAVVACVLNGYSEIDTPVNVHLRGGMLTDTYRSDGSVIMEGPAVKVFEGIVDTDDLV